VGGRKQAWLDAYLMIDMCLTSIDTNERPKPATRSNVPVRRGTAKAVRPSSETRRSAFPTLVFCRLRCSRFGFAESYAWFCSTQRPEKEKSRIADAYEERPFSRIKVREHAALADILQSGRDSLNAN